MHSKWQVVISYWKSGSDPPFFEKTPGFFFLKFISLIPNFLSFHPLDFFKAQFLAFEFPATSPTALSPVQYPSCASPVQFAFFRTLIDNSVVFSLPVPRGRLTRPLRELPGLSRDAFSSRGGCRHDGCLPELGGARKAVKPPRDTPGEDRTGYRNRRDTPRVTHWIRIAFKKL